MTHTHIVKLVTSAVIAPCLLAGTALASTTGTGTGGSPSGGLLIMLVLLAAFALFCFAYLLLDRMLQGRIDWMRKSNNVEGLIRALRSSWLGPKAARALGEIGDLQAIGPLVGALGDDREYLRKAAARALGKLGDPRAIEPLSKALDDRYASVRDCARQALESINRRRGKNIGFA